MERMAGDVEKREVSTGGEGLKRDTLPFVLLLQAGKMDTGEGKTIGGHGRNPFVW
jgi:hypothetical protein